LLRSANDTVADDALLAEATSSMVTRRRAIAHLHVDQIWPERTTLFIVFQ
jgi:hypothetical protein